MAGKIVLLGASGYTGRRVAGAMVSRGVAPVLAGRSTARLAPLADRLGGLQTAVADVTDPASVRALIDPGDVLVSTVGPFLRLGDTAVSAAVDAGAIYLDSAGEPPFIRRVFEEYGPAARESGASLLTAFGNDYVPGNLAGALALREAGQQARRVEIGYYLTGGGRAQLFSRGTLASLAGVITERGFTYRDGAVRAEPAGMRMRTWPVAGADRPALTIGASEHFALPRAHPGLAEVDVYLGWLGPATRPAHLVTRAARTVERSSRLRGVLSRVPDVRPWVRRATDVAAGRVAEEPDAAALDRATSTFLADTFDRAGRPLAQVRLITGEPYRLTADLLAWGAQRAAEHGVSAPGALGPVDAFGLDTLEAGCAELGLRRP